MVKENNQDLMVGLDVGCSHITAVVGCVDQDGEMNIVGYGQAPSTGLNRGSVVNIDSTVSAIRQAIEAAEVMAGCQINSTYTAMADSFVRGMNSEGMVPIREKEVTLHDVYQVMDAAKTIAIPQDQRIMHILPQEFMVDKQGNIREPLGMSGVRLEAKVHMITGANSTIENIDKCVRRCGLQVNDIILKQLAASYSVLSEEEKEQGVCLIDIGAGTTNVAVFQKGAICHTQVLPVGGNQVSSDIAIAMRLPTQTAENIKVQHACAVAEAISHDRVVQVEALGNCPAHTVSLSELAQVVQARYEELFELIRDSLAQSGLLNHLKAGVVLTGGAAQVQYLPELAQHIFNVSARLGLPQHIKGLSDVANNPQFSTSVGLLLYACHQEKQQKQFKKPSPGVKGFIAKIKQWFQGNF